MEKKKMKVLLDALTFYKDIASQINSDELEIIDEQIGALRANLFGEEHGWRDKEGQAVYEAKRAKVMETILQKAIEKTKIVPLTQKKQENNET